MKTCTWTKIKEEYICSCCGKVKDFPVKLQCDGIFYPNQDLQVIDGNKNFISNEIFAHDCIEFANNLPPISAVAGIPRSGMIPASIIAVYLNLPLYSVDSNLGIYKHSARSNTGGYRMRVAQDVKDPILVIDDTVAFGHEMTRVRSLLKDKGNFIYGAIYSSKEGIKFTNLIGKILTFPHLLEWNLFNAYPTINGILDMDGVLCEDVPINCDNDDDEYINFILNAKPFKHRLPKLFPCNTICTGRLEKYRKVTEYWLDLHQVKYKNLVMFQGSKKERDGWNHTKVVGNYKAKVFTESKTGFFIESCPYQSQIIANISKKTVISINEKKIC